MKSCISGVEVINCSNVRIYVHEKTPSISADTSQSVAVVLSEQNLECDIVSSKTSELTVAYRKADQSESKAVAVSSQLVTKWDADSKQFKTTVYDKFLWYNHNYCSSILILHKSTPSEIFIWIPQ